jgi:transcriptional regulator with XRE-family HTH domain
MTQAALGFLLKILRARRGLSLRELGRLADVDHAYIYRLETGDKESPSPEVLAKLIKALKPDKREADILHYLSNHVDTTTELVDLAVNDPTISAEIFTAVAGMAHRGKRPNYVERIQLVRRILEEESGDG